MVTFRTWRQPRVAIPRTYCSVSFGPVQVAYGVLQSAPMMPRGLQYCVTNHSFSLANLNLHHRRHSAVSDQHGDTTHLQYQERGHNRGTEFVMVWHTVAPGGILRTMEMISRTEYPRGKRGDSNHHHHNNNQCSHKKEPTANSRWES